MDMLLYCMHALAVNLYFTCTYTCLKGHNPDGTIQVLDWNMMGLTHKGLAEARSEIVLANIQGYDIVFLQEVQWAETGIKGRLATPAGYEVAMTRSKGADRNTCILYNSGKLHEDPDSVTRALIMSNLANWHDEYSQRLCVRVFTLVGKGNTSKFVAISLHAPNDVHMNNTFCELVRAFIEEVVTVHRLPVLVGGDFNSDIRHWNLNDGDFLGLDYEAGRNPIDFIVMRVPTGNIHLEMAVSVRVMRQDEIDLPEDAQDLQVVMARGGMRQIIPVREFKEQYSDSFFMHLCGNHMPLNTVIRYI